MIELAVLDVNETLFPLDPVAARLREVGLDGQLELWFARILRDGIAATAAGRLAPFADLGRHHLEVLFSGRGQDVPAGAAEHVLGGFGDVEPHPDVAPGLRRLRDHGITAVALTNGSGAITERFLARCELDTLVAAVHEVTEVGRWKPAPEPYRYVLSRHGVSGDRAALVAVHPWDVLGGQSAGLTGAWLDRDRTTYPAPFGAPDLRAPDLPALADALVQLSTDG